MFKLILAFICMNVAFDVVYWPHHNPLGKVCVQVSYSVKKFSRCKYHEMFSELSLIQWLPLAKFSSQHFTIQSPLNTLILPCGNNSWLLCTHLKNCPVMVLKLSNLKELAPHSQPPVISKVHTKIDGTLIYNCESTHHSTKVEYLSLFGAYPWLKEPSHCCVWAGSTSSLADHLFFIQSLTLANTIVHLHYFTFESVHFLLDHFRLSKTP